MREYFLIKEIEPINPARIFSYMEFVDLFEFICNNDYLQRNDSMCLLYNVLVWQQCIDLVLCTYMHSFLKLDL